MDLKNIKEVEYNSLECFGNREAKCPYCGYDNFIESEDYGGQDDEEIEECGECGKYFVHQIDYSITFTSEPYENYYLRSKKSIARTIEHYNKSLKKAREKKLRSEREESDIQYYSYMAKNHEQSLMELEEEAKQYLGAD